MLNSWFAFLKVLYVFSYVSKVVAGVKKKSI